MGKDSLLKSTSKKTAAAKKKAGAKAAVSSKKASAKGGASKPANSKSRTAAANKTAARTAAAKPVAGRKKSASNASKTIPAAAPAKISIRDLLHEKFAMYPAPTPFKPQAEDREAPAASPPFISASDPAEAARLKELLLEKLDLEAMAAAAKAASAAAEIPEAPQETRAPEVSEAATPEAPLEAQAPEASETPAPEAPPETQAPEAAAAASEAPAETPAPEVEAPAPATCASAAGAPPHEGVDRSVLEGFGGPEPLSRSAIMGIVSFVMLMLLIVGASYSNSHNYYLKAADGGLEIWQGAFAPMGRKLLVTLPGVKAPETVADVYGRDEVYPLAYDYFVAQADRLLEAPGLPDFESIKARLAEARKFATSPDAQRMIRIRNDYIDLFILRYKAEVAAAKDTVASLEAAIGYLREAERLAAEDSESAEITKRIEQLGARQAQLAEAARQAEIEAAGSQAVLEAEPGAASAPEAGDAAQPGEGGNGQADAHGEEAPVTDKAAE